MESNKAENNLKEKSINVKAAESKEFSTQLFDLRTSKGQLLFITITVLISCLIQSLPPGTVQQFIGSLSHSQDENAPQANCSNLEADSRPTYALFGKSKTDDHLRHVEAVLQRFGFRKTVVEDNWDLLWAHDYPYRLLGPKMKSLEAHQKVNHIPGCGFITNKVDLCTSDLEHIPRGFKLPQDKPKFLEYSAKNPDKLFVQKHNQHRHIHIKSVKEIDFDSNETFIQEFVDNPYLVDGYKFDIGVYVIVTSVDPLRVYIYKGDVLFRYCPVQYYPLDPKNVDKYIVGDDYLPTWEVPSLTTYYNELGFGMKDSFDAYVRSKNQNPAIIWEQVEEAIRTTILAKEKHLVEILRNYKSKRNFFEMMRFDLVIDSDLKVHLMEANMSPNLSSAHFKQNTLLYEQVIYSMFNLVGVGSPLARESLRKRSKDAESMITSTKNIAVQANICSRHPCSDSCDPEQCRICIPCLENDELGVLHTAAREHLHRIDTKRIFPKPIKNLTSYAIEKEVKGLSPTNKLMTLWFYEKCRMESSWCS